MDLLIVHGESEGTELVASTRVELVLELHPGGEKGASEENATLFPPCQGSLRVCSPVQPQGMQEG